MRELALFAGGGGSILGGYLLGWETVCVVEIEQYRIECLLQRQRDGILPWFPIWDDIQTFDGKPWRNRVDIISGGFPCQDISLAGKGAGITGTKSGLWKEMSRVVSDVRPRFVFVENSPALLVRGFSIVAGDLVEMGYDLRWCVLGADDARAPHRRKRIWILAYRESKRCREEREYKKQHAKRITDCKRLEKQRGTKSDEQKQPCPKLPSITWWDCDPADLPNTDEFNDDNSGYGTSEVSEQQEAEVQGDISNTGYEYGETGIPRDVEEKKEKRSLCKLFDQSSCKRQGDDFRTTQSRLGRVAYGVASRVDRLKAIGDGQVPAVAALAFVILSEGLI